MSGRRTRFAVATLAFVAAIPAPSRVLAQEFTPIVPAPLELGTCTLLDLGLPVPNRGAEFASGFARPFGLAELDGGTLSAGAGWQAARLALGVAGSGDAEIGWNTLAAAAGGARSDGGAAFRVAVRRDRLRPAGSRPARDGEFASSPEASESTGGEIGAGGWIDLGRSVRAWIAHPQLATRGAAPPLRRGLDAGIAWSGEGLRAWLAREAAPRAAYTDAHRAGIALGGARGWVWAEVREGPLRATLGLAGRAGAIEAAAAVDSHPVLGETVRLALKVGGGQP